MLDLVLSGTFSARPLSIRIYRAGALSLQLLPTTGKLALRGTPGNTSLTHVMARLFNVSLPTKANTAATAEFCTIMWRAPDEWLIELPLELLDSKASLLEVTLEAGLSDQRIRIGVLDQ